MASLRRTIKDRKETRQTTTGKLSKEQNFEDIDQPEDPEFVRSGSSEQVKGPNVAEGEGDNEGNFMFEHGYAEDEGPKDKHQPEGSEFVRSYKATTVSSEQVKGPNIAEGVGDNEGDFMFEHGYVEVEGSKIENVDSKEISIRLSDRDRQSAVQVSTDSEKTLNSGQMDLYVDLQDFEVAKKRVRPSALREVLVEVPRVLWNDIGGNEDIKQCLQEAVEWPHKHAKDLERVGATAPKGVLLYGPPGCSKTLMARAVATEGGLNFLPVKGPELLSKWVGESEKAVRTLFARARASAPSIIFFDEIDGLTASRENGQGEESTSVGDRVISQLLIEMDGLSPLTGVSVLAATNRPDIIDSALLRPGRFDRLIYVGPPGEPARQQIYEIHLRCTPCDTNVDVTELARRSQGYTGADISAVCREAAMGALEEDLSAEKVCMRHFEAVFLTFQASTSQLSAEVYRRFERGGKELGNFLPLQIR